MLENTNRIHRLLAGAAAGTLVLALAIGAGAVPRPGDDTVRTAAVSDVVEEAASNARQPGDSAKDAATSAAAPAAAAQAAAQEAPPTTIATPKATTAPPTTRAAVAKPKVAPATTPAPVVAAAPAPTTPPPPATVARRTPTAAEVQSAIGELKRQVGGLLLLVSPTPAQIAQAGDQVCTAFDNGQTFAQVKATGLSMIPASVTVLPATADWAVRQAVALYCPGHANKLV